MKKPVIGVFALQGCVTPHRRHVEATGSAFLEVRDPRELAEVDGLILPGGESTTLLTLIRAFDLERPLSETFRRVPVWGICAGAILIARQVVSPEQKSYGLLDMQVVRNAYGRQLDSFHAEISGYPVSFIRAPKLDRVGPDVEVLARHGDAPVWVRSGRFMATTFHPELTESFPSPMHQSFAQMVLQLWK